MGRAGAEKGRGGQNRMTREVYLTVEKFRMTQVVHKSQGTSMKISRSQRTHP